MDLRSISLDDIEDVEQLTEEIGQALTKILDDHELDLAISAIITSTILSIVNQCDNVKQLIFYRNAFVRFFDATIREIKMKMRKKSS